MAIAMAPPPRRAILISMFRSLLHTCRTMLPFWYQAPCDHAQSQNRNSSSTVPLRGWWWAGRSNRNAVLQIGGTGRRGAAELSRILPRGHVADGRRARDLPTARRLLPREWAAGLALALLWACGQAASPPPSEAPAPPVSPPPPPPPIASP